MKISWSTSWRSFVMMRIRPNGGSCRLGRIHRLHSQLRAGKEIVCRATVAVLRKNAAVCEIEYIPPGYAAAECFTLYILLCCVKGVLNINLTYLLYVKQI